MTTTPGYALQILADVAGLGWQDEALCAQVDPALHFPGKGQDNFARKARAICRLCPVTQPCLEYALEYEARRETAGRHGIYGGTSPRERRAIAAARDRRAA